MRIAAATSSNSSNLNDSNHSKDPGNPNDPVRLHPANAWRLFHRLPLLHASDLLHIVRASGLAALDHDVLNVAQAAAYSAVLALFPALIVAAAIVGMLPASLPVRTQLGLFFTRILPANVLPLLDEYFSVTHPSQTAGALLGSLVVGLVGAGNVMATLMEGFRRAHGLPLVRGSFLRRRIRALVLVPLSILPMAAASALVVFGNSLTHWMAAALPRSLQAPFTLLALVVRWSIALGGSTAILLTIYHLGTDLSTGMRDRVEPYLRQPWQTLHRQWTWRLSFPGALLGTLLWFLSTLLFGFYVTRYANYNRVYGSLGAGIALMIWLYLIALCVLAGAEFNAQVYLRFPPLRNSAQQP